MSERIPVRHEETHSKERHVEAKEHLKKVEASRAEKAGEHSHSEKGNETEHARHEVHEQAISGAEYEQPSSEQPQQQPIYDKAAKEHSFNTTMHHVRRSLSKPERQLSKFIHQPAIEKTSEVLGKTVARPSGIMGATVAAFIGLLSIYSVAKFAGFQLSGSEMPFLLLGGFALGLFLEWIYKSTRSILGRRAG